MHLLLEHSNTQYISFEELSDRANSYPSFESNGIDGIKKEFTEFIKFSNNSTDSGIERTPGFMGAIINNNERLVGKISKFVKPLILIDVNNQSNMNIEKFKKDFNHSLIQVNKIIQLLKMYPKLRLYLWEMDHKNPGAIAILMTEKEAQAQLLIPHSQIHLYHKEYSKYWKPLILKLVMYQDLLEASIKTQNPYYIQFYLMNLFALHKD